MIIGRTLVYRDEGHLTATFAQALAPYLAAQLPPLDQGSLASHGLRGRYHRATLPTIPSDYRDRLCGPSGPSSIRSGSRPVLARP